MNCHLPYQRYTQPTIPPWMNMYTSFEICIFNRAAIVSVCILLQVTVRFQSLERCKKGYLLFFAFLFLADHRRATAWFQMIKYLSL